MPGSQVYQYTNYCNSNFDRQKNIDTKIEHKIYSTIQELFFIRPSDEMVMKIYDGGKPL